MYQGSFIQIGDQTVALITQVDANGVPIVPGSAPVPSGASLTQVAYAAGSVPLLAANAARRKFRLVNPTNKTIYLAYGPTASLTAYTESVASLGDYEDEFSGQVSVIWASAPAGGPKLQITEVF